MKKRLSPVLGAVGVAVLSALGGCSTLWVGELGYSHHVNGPLEGATGAMHVGFGMEGPGTDSGVAGGLGFSGRIRSYGAPYSVFEPGIHGYMMADSGDISFYLRGTGYVGLSLLSDPGRPGVTFSPTLQPGLLFCSPDRVGWCFSASLPVGYDVATAGDRPGLHAGVSFGIGWGNVVSRNYRPW